jgi:hypothetical protein
VLHFSLTEVLLVAFIWVTITLGPVLAGLLLSLVRRRKEPGRRT